MSFHRQRRIGADHPSLAGHFPGNPVVPGVVILDEVLEALHQWQPETQTAGFSSVKFLAPLLPEQEFEIQLQQSQPQRIKFVCQRDQTVLANGQISVR